MSGEPERRPEPPRPWWWAPLPILLLLFGLITWQFFATGERPPEHSVTYSTFYGLVEAGKVAKVTLGGQNVTGTLKNAETVDGKSLTDFRTVLPESEDRELLPLLRSKNVEITAESTRQSFVVPLLITLLPW